jgi:hypothetical protein
LASTTTVTKRGASPGCVPSALGRSRRIELAISGAVMMKMTTSTSITSTSGVTLMSLMGARALGALEAAESHGSALPAGRACVQQLAQVAREAFEVGLDAADQAAEDVVAQHGRDGDGQAGRRHDQRLADRAGDLVDADLAGAGDAGQRVVDAPDRAEQADEGRGGAHRGQQHLAELQLVQDAVQRVAQHARELLAAVAGGGQRAARLVGGGVDQRQHQRLAVEGGDLLLRLGQRGPARRRRCCAATSPRPAAAARPSRG